MKHHSLKFIWSTLLVLLCSFAANAVIIIPVSGPDTACVNSTKVYSVSVSAGITYTWSIAPVTSGTSIGGPNGTNSIVWMNTGNATVTVLGKDNNGTLIEQGTKLVHVFPNPVPYITTSFRVACEGFVPGKGGPKGKGTGGAAPAFIAPPQDTTRKNPVPTVLDDANGCPKVCEFSTVTYYANGDPTGTKGWSVTGGTIVANYNDSILVTWGAAGTQGSITLYDTSIAHCVGQKTVCIEIIERPKASFSVLPSLTPKPSYTVCLGAQLVFHDLSVASPGSPIVTWFWNFGDGQTSQLQNPTHTYGAAGSYTAELTVTNSCGCSHKFKVKITVQPKPGPVILCTAVACENDTATYYTVGGCGSYNWSVIGGSIVSGLGTNAIVVKWDNIGDDGYGYVSLSEPCAACPGTTTIKIPVIQSNPTILGPTLLCTNQQYEFSMPLWAATQYQWGVIGNPGAVVSGRDDHKVMVLFNSPGTYTIHVWYQNRIRLCGGDIKFNVTVVAPTTISGNVNICKGSTETYTLSGGAIGNWTLTPPGGGSPIVGTGNTFTNTFTAGGDYVLSASGSFCEPAPLVIHVQELDKKVDSISGPINVCLNRPYNYSAYASTPGAIFEWVVTGGTVVPNNGTPTMANGDQVTITWTSTGTKTLKVYRVATAQPHCQGPDTTITINEILVNPNVTGPSPVCANSYTNYNSNYTGADVYSWNIFPTGAGSVTSGNYGPIAQILWANVTAVTNAAVVVSVTRCNKTVLDTLWVVVNPSPLVAITPASSSICTGTPITFTATPGAASYFWEFGDGTSITTASNVSPAHTYASFPASSGNATLTVKVTATGIGSGFSCAPIGVGTAVVVVKPGPIAAITPAGSTIFCTGTPVSLFMQTVVTNNVGTISYQWYNGSGPIGGATASSYTATSANSYYVIVTDATTGCTYQSLAQTIIVSPCTPVPGCGGTVSANYTISCNTITANGFGGGTLPQWVYTGSPSSVSGQNTTTMTITYPVPGDYTLQFSEQFPVSGGGTCRAYTNMPVKVPLVADHYWTWTCGTQYSVTFSDHSAYLPGYTLSVPTWNVSGPGGTFTGSGNNFTVASIPSGTYTVTETVSATSGASTVTCIVVKTIVVPVVPSISIAVAPNPICEGVAVNCIATAVPTSSIANYLWSFGDGTTSLLGTTQRTYNIPGSATSQNFGISLDVTDVVGCVQTFGQTETIYNNFMQGSILGDSSACAGMTILLSYNSIGGTPVSYAWSHGPTTPSAVVSQTGAYFVTAYDVHQCRGVTPDKNVTILSPNAVVISGDNEYCFGQSVLLSGYLGAGYTYSWTRNGGAAGTGADLTDAGLPAGTYFYQLTVNYVLNGVNCTQTSAVDTVIIHPQPVPPIIGGPSVINCTTYDLKLTGTHPSGSPTTFNWSNGVYGQTNLINHGGPYRLWYTDQYGCGSSADVVVPESPESYFDWFPSGCYVICKGMFPINLYGPPGTFAGWSWLMNGGTVSSGVNSVITPYAIPGSGTYQLGLNNGLCTALTPKMDVATKDCECQKVIRDSRLDCDPDPNNPAGYILTLVINNPVPGTTYTVGMDVGPVVPFTFTLPTPGLNTLTLNFTTLTVPAPSSVVIKVHYYLPGGRECYDELKLNAPPCNWVAEKPAPGANESIKKSATAMMVFPNPATSQLSIGYNFGTEAGEGTGNRHVVVYDLTGREVYRQQVDNVTGTLTFPINEWASAVYLVRMEEAGKTLHMQRVSVTH